MESDGGVSLNPSQLKLKKILIFDKLREYAIEVCKSKKMEECALFFWDSTTFHEECEKGSGSAISAEMIYKTYVERSSRYAVELPAHLRDKLDQIFRKENLALSTSVPSDIFAEAQKDCLASMVKAGVLTTIVTSPHYEKHRAAIENQPEDPDVVVVVEDDDKEREGRPARDEEEKEKRSEKKGQRRKSLSASALKKLGKKKESSKDTCKRDPRESKDQKGADSGSMLSASKSSYLRKASIEGFEMEVPEKATVADFGYSPNQDKLEFVDTMLASKRTWVMTLGQKLLKHASNHQASFQAIDELCQFLSNFPQPLSAFTPAISTITNFCTKVKEHAGNVNLLSVVEETVLEKLYLQQCELDRMQNSLDNTTMDTMVEEMAAVEREVLFVLCTYFRHLTRVGVVSSAEVERVGMIMAAALAKLNPHTSLRSTGSVLADRQDPSVEESSARPTESEAVDSEVDSTQSEGAPFSSISPTTSKVAGRAKGFLSFVEDDDVLSKSPISKKDSPLRPRNAPQAVFKSYSVVVGKSDKMNEPSPTTKKWALFKKKDKKGLDNKAQVRKMSSSTSSFPGLASSKGESDGTVDFVQSWELVTVADASGGTRVTGGTIRALVWHLVTNTDLPFRETFISTFPCFTTPAEFLDLLLESVHFSEDSLTSDEKSSKPNGTSQRQIRAIAMLKMWMDKLPEDWTPPMRNTLLEFLNTATKSNLPSAFGQIRKRMEQLDAVPPEVAPKPPVDVPPGAINMAILTDTDICEQLCLIEFEFFSALKGKEFLDQKWAKKSQKSEAQNIITMVQFSNKIAGWVMTEVLRRVKAVDRAKIIARFLNIATTLRKMNNLNGMMEIVSGLAITPINRLKRSWALLDEKETSLWNSLQEITSNSNNFKSLRHFMKNMPAPAIPYLGLFLTDITFINEGNPDKTESGLINFGKMTLLADVLKDIEQFKQLGYEFSPIPSIQNWLKTYPTLESSEGYALSTRYEPRDPIPILEQLLQTEQDLKAQVEELHARCRELEGHKDNT
mmetsp:Transcript_23448/g.58675  ORF Transcript_23448/g.58675 Transcript_23448/m.58675 type:complete len:1017 (-) Transcript_23448:81-3131(-)